jgi:LysM repeat protein
VVFVLTFASTPLTAQAGIISSIFGGDAYAKNTPPSAPVQLSQTSGTISLLEANVSSASILDEKDKKNDKSKGSKEKVVIDEELDVNIVSESAILPMTGPMGVYDGKEVVDSSLLETSVYVVRKGDSISQIADMFEVSVNTILWANNMKKGDKLVEGDILLILPISGLEHTVTKGQTLQSIAKLYKVDVNDIIMHNDISIDTKLAVGDKLMVPDAVKAEESDKPIKNISDSIAKDKKYYETHPVKNLAGYFINPVPGYRKSQGIHDKNAVDLAIKTGTPILASAEGKVTLARYGYNGGYGNLVIIKHPNGTETLYAHMSKLGTSTGAEVYQGQVIGYVGSTGRSTGPHLHFEVHGARNPGADASWKY